MPKPKFKRIPVKQWERINEVIDYVSANDDEYNDYLDWCETHGKNPMKKNHTEHIFGIIREAMGLGPMKAEDLGSDAETFLK